MLCCTQYASKFGKFSSDHRLEKVSFHSNSKERQCQRMFKLQHNCTHLTHLVTLKILQARLQQYVNHELPDIQAGFRKGRGTRDQIANICWIERDLLDLLLSKKQESSRKTKTKTKHFYFCFVDYTKAFISALLTIPKPLTVWITTNCGKYFKRWEYQTN